MLAEIREHDAILLGAVGGRPGDPNLPPGILERGLLLRLRFELDHYVNLRPSRIFPGVTSPLADPGEVDFVVVREGTEGPYTGNGGALRVGTPHEIATEVSVNTAYGVERVVRDAFARAAAPAAQEAHPGAQDQRAWSTPAPCGRRLVREVAPEFPDVAVDYLHVDAATIFLATDPARFDVIVTDNLFGDIITDLAAAVTGGIGLAACGNVNPDRTTPSMFEPVHGSAPDIAGQQKADPTAAILSAALLLDHLGHSDAAAGRRGRRARRPGRTSTRGAPGVPPRSATRSPADRRLVRPGATRQPVSLAPPSPTEATPKATTLMSMQISTTRTETRSTTPGCAEILADPGFGLHFTDHMFIVEWTPDRGLARRPDHAVRPAQPRPGHRGPALRAGDLRGHEGLPARRTARSGPSGPRRTPRGWCARAQRLALPELPAERLRRGGRRAGARSTSAGCPTQAGEKSLYIRPFMFASEVFLGVRPAQHVTFMVIARPAGAYFKGGLKPVTLWLTEDYTRAGRGGMGAAKTGGNYASSLVAQQEATEQGCDQVVFLDAAGGHVRRGARRHEPLLRPRRRPDRHPGDSAPSSRASPAPRSSSSPASSATRSRSAGSRSTSGATASTSGEITEVFACGTAAVVTPVGS